MISFSCTHCGMKFQAKPQFAGRSSRCPTCKEPLVVPTPDRTLVAPGQIDGTPSSLVQAGADGGVTLDHATRPGQVSVRDLLARQSGKGQRYVIEQEIARGGMGAVLRAIDCDIRREVAVKFLLDQTDPAKKLRFIEEAQITGQLEHPNIVPIHELGVDKQKRLFFSMKMVKGRSLAQVLDELRKDPKSAEKEWSAGRLLNILVNVCHALAYAHSRQVVHRDLKPANIMVGDFGEVYVMDWGLAKVLASGVASAPRESSATGNAPSRGADAAPLASSVMTSREAEADLTQEGAVMGTPVYMPPEQAAGKLHAIDQRSDVYSLGAILYELLTLQPPIDKEGGYLAVLMRVMEGEIVPPEQRNPQRAKAGKVPPELSAIALKAMARRPEDRYPSAEALRRDIERFQEGRSVSAKHDTVREAVWKLVKRNKAVSLVSAVALVLLAFLWGRSSWINAEERSAREKLMKEAVPAFVRSAHVSISEQRFDDALAQVTVALENDRGNTKARLLKGQLLIARKDFGRAHAEIEQYLRDRPEDADARQLAELCGKAGPEDTAALLAFIDVLQRQKEYVLAESLTRTKDDLLKAYRRRINDAWPPHGDRLTVDKNGKLTLDLTNCSEVTDLGALRGMALSSLDLSNTKVTSLAPLEGMKLTWLRMTCPVRDLSPLRNMPITHLNMYGCDGIVDLSPVAGMPLTTLSLSHAHHVADLTPLKGLPLITLDIYGTDVHDISPLKGNTSLTTLTLGSPIRDFTPLKGLPLTTLTLESPIRDFTPLKGLPLTTLNLRCPGLQDLSTLAGMKLTRLDLWSCVHVHDLTPLQGMPITHLNLIETGVEDLTPLAGLPLEEFRFTPRTVKRGIEVIRRMKSMKAIGIHQEAEKMLQPKVFWTKYEAGELGK